MWQEILIYASLAILWSLIGINLFSMILSWQSYFRRKKKFEAQLKEMEELLERWRRELDGSKY